MAWKSSIKGYYVYQKTKKKKENERKNEIEFIGKTGTPLEARLVIGNWYTTPVKSKNAE